MIYAAWLTWLIPLLSVPLVPIASALDSRLRGWVAVCSSGLSLLVATYAALTYSSPVTETLVAWFSPLSVSIQVEVDGLSVLVAAFVSFVSFLVVVYSLGYMKAEEGQTRYYSLVLLFVGSMLGLVMAGNLVQLYFFWELVGVCSALLIAFWTDRPAARRAGVKAFVVTRLGDTALLAAVILVATTFGTTTFSTVLGPSGVATLGSGAAFLIAVLVVLGAMGKSAQVPLHAWLPDAMEGPTTVSALIHAATMVNAGVFLLLRMYPLVSLPQLSGSVTSLILVVGLLSALVGGASAFAADDIKRVLAYSTISQLGLMFAAVGFGSLTASAYHMISQGLFKALAFLAVGSVVTALGTRQMSEMGGLARTMKVTYVGFLLSVLAMSGVPPLVGFWSKDAILSEAYGAGALPAAAVLAAFALTALYSFRALFRVFHGPPQPGATPHEAPPSMLVPVILLSAAVLTAWAVLQSQTLLSFSSFWTPQLVPVASSLLVLSASGAVAYAACLAYRDRALGLLHSSRPLESLRSLLYHGFGFDRLYSAVANAISGPVSRAASALQTELLGANIALALALVVLIFVLFASRALS